MATIDIEKQLVQALLDDDDFPYKVAEQISDSTDTDWWADCLCEVLEKKDNSFIKEVIQQTVEEFLDKNLESMLEEVIEEKYDKIVD